jgi:hypothetical protein
MISISISHGLTLRVIDCFPPDGQIDPSDGQRERERERERKRGGQLAAIS